MSNPNNDAWHSNMRAKGNEIQSLIDQVLRHLPSDDPGNRKKFNELLSTTIQKCKAMHDLFGPNLIPGPLAHLTSELEAWQKNLREPTHLKRIIGLYDPIGKINGTDGADTPSFTSILEKHREDQTLQECLTELISALEQLLADGDAILTNQAAVELERILKEIRIRKKTSIADLLPWVEFALTSAGAVIDTCYGTPVASIAINATLTAKKTQSCIRKLVKVAYSEFIDSLNLKGKAKFDGEFARAIVAAPIESIEAAVKEQGGLKRLPAPVNEEPTLKLEDSSKD